MIKRALTSFGEVVLLGASAVRAAPRRPLETRGFLHEIHEQGNRALGLLAIMSAVVTALPTAWAFLGILGVLALAIPNSYVVSAPARGDVPWLTVAGYVTALAAAMLFTLSYVRAREY